MITYTDVVKSINTSKETANQLIRKFEKLNIIREISGKKRYKKYILFDYINIIKRGTEL